MAITAGESFNFAGISASPPAFTIKGGLYALILSGTTISVQLEMLSADGVTFAPVEAAAIAVAGVTSPIYLPPGKCLVNATGSSGANVTLARIQL